MPYYQPCDSCPEDGDITCIECGGWFCYQCHGSHDCGDETGEDE